MKNKTTGSRCITNEKYAKVRTDRDRYYNTQEHFNSDYARHTESDDRRVSIFRTSNNVASQPSKEEYSTLWAPLYETKVSFALAKYLYELDVRDFVPCVEMPHTAEKDYQIVQSLTFPFNALHECLERGYLVRAEFIVSFA